MVHGQPRQAVRVAFKCAAVPAAQTRLIPRRIQKFLLPDGTVRTADDPDRAVAQFLQTTYEAAGGGQSRIVVD